MWKWTPESLGFLLSKQWQCAAVVWHQQSFRSLLCSAVRSCSNSTSALGLRGTPWDSVGLRQSSSLRSAYNSLTILQSSHNLRKALPCGVFGVETTRSQLAISDPREAHRFGTGAGDRGLPQRRRPALGSDAAAQEGPFGSLCARILLCSVADAQAICNSLLSFCC